MFSLKNREFYEKTSNNYLNKIIKNAKIITFSMFSVYILSICYFLFIQFSTKNFNLDDKKTIVITALYLVSFTIMFSYLLRTYIKENRHTYVLKNYLPKNKERNYNEELRKGEFFGNFFAITEKNIFSLKSTFFCYVLFQ